MIGIAKSAVEAFRKLPHLLCRCGLIIFYWKLKFLKTKAQQWKRCSAQKQLLHAQSGLGAEIYALYKQGETGWEGMPLLKECLTIVEAAEGAIFKIEAKIEEIKEDYAAKVERVKAKYPCACNAENSNDAD